MLDHTIRLMFIVTSELIKEGGDAGLEGIGIFSFIIFMAIPCSGQPQRPERGEL
jgi:hypothetical protein